MGTPMIFQGSPCPICGRPILAARGRPAVYCRPQPGEESSPCYILAKRLGEMRSAARLVMLSVAATGDTIAVARALQEIKASLWRTANELSNQGKLARSERPAYKKTRSGWRRNADAPDRSPCADGAPTSVDSCMEFDMTFLLLLIGCLSDGVELHTTETGHDLDADTGAGTVDAPPETDTAGTNATCTGAQIEGWPERVTAAPTWQKRVTGCGTIIGALCADPDVARVDLDSVSLMEGVDVTLVALGDDTTTCELVVLDDVGENHAFIVAVDAIPG